MKVLEARMRDDGIRRRTYLTASGRKVLTYEVPATVINQLGRKGLAAAMAQWERIKARDARKDLICQRIREGVKPTAIAHEFGVTEQRVRQLRIEMGLGPRPYKRKEEG